MAITPFDTIQLDWGVPYLDDRAERLIRQELHKHRGQAVENLWQRAVDQVTVRHPDPKVDVKITVFHYSGIELPTTRIQFAMYNMTDTGDRSKKTIDGFQHIGSPRGWPGYRVAHKYITSLWALYCMHEAFELVTYRGQPLIYQAMTLDREGRSSREKRVTETPVIDAHADSGANQNALSRTWDIASTLDWGLGLGEGQKLIDENRERAEQDVTDEIASLEGK